jgi:hypothetical protein
MHHLPDESDNVSKLQANFEGKEAIYVEKGALLVRVSDIRSSALRPTVAAQIDELPAPGLGVGGFDRKRLNRRTPLRWTIRAGYLTEFSDDCWTMGYAGWSIYFEPRLVQAVLELASGFSPDVNTFERYRAISHLLQRDQAIGQANWQSVFPAAPLQYRW